MHLNSSNNSNLTWRWFERQTPHKHKSQSTLEASGLVSLSVDWCETHPFICYCCITQYGSMHRTSPVGSVGNGLRLCFGVAVALYLAQGRHLLRLKPATALPRTTLMELNSVKRHTRRRGWSCFPNSSLRWLPVRERGFFLWPFASDRNTCFLLPVIATLQRKFKEKS